MVTGLIILLCTVLVNGVTSLCSWENCHPTRQDMLNVHLVSHSHDDAGWKKTVYQYFWGSNQTEYRIEAGVQYIISTVVDELAKDPKRRFSQCETAFLWRWWRQQNNETKATVRRLINTGQLEIVGGGWVQNDEATTHYSATIDQLSLGHSWLLENLGSCAVPRVAWQLDPFGHSKEMASLFAQAGFEAEVFARAHFLDKQKRLEERRLEMVWHASDDLGVSSNLLTSILYEHYSPPKGFCFDEYHCTDDPIMDDPELDEYNVDEKVNLFLDYVHRQARHFSTNHILVPMGDDFLYGSAVRWFKNLDKLIFHVNLRVCHKLPYSSQVYIPGAFQQSAGLRVNLIYSTPSCYFKGVRSAQQAFPTKFDDFFPYAGDAFINKPHKYWTGFFTSRPALKYFGRYANGVLQACKQLAALSHQEKSQDKIFFLSRAVALLQHHDGISGTEVDHVSKDYSKRLSTGIRHCQVVFNSTINRITGVEGVHKICTLLNVSLCPLTETLDHFIVSVYNSLGWQQTAFVRFPISPNSRLVVRDFQGNAINTQIVRSFLPESQFSYLNRTSAVYDLIFATSLPPLGLAQFHIQRLEEQISFAVERSVSQTVAISNQHIRLTFHHNTGLLKSYKDVFSGSETKLKQNFFFYQSAKESQPGHQASGHYAFRPNSTQAYPISLTAKLQVVRGTHVSEVRQIFSPWISQVVRLYSDKPYAEFEWTVGPIPVSDNNSREIISRFETDIASGGLFYTDSNGRQMMLRVRNFQSTYKFDNLEPVAANYYPVTSCVYIKDPNHRLTLLTDRAEGASSLADGAVEVMLHRRLLQVDHSAVHEPLDELGADGRGLVVRGRFWLVLAPSTHAVHRRLAPPLARPPLQLFSPPHSPFLARPFSGLRKPLPPNVHLLTLEAPVDGEVLFRLEHIYQKHEHSELSQDAHVRLTDLFSTITLTSCKEFYLSAALVKNQSVPQYIHLTAMQIRTFRCRIAE